VVSGGGRVRGRKRGEMGGAMIIATKSRARYPGI